MLLFVTTAQSGKFSDLQIFDKAPTLGCGFAAHIINRYFVMCPP